MAHCPNCGEALVVTRRDSVEVNFKSLDEERIKAIKARENYNEIRSFQLLKAVAEVYDVHPRAILGEGRTKRVAEARHVLSWLLRMEQWSLKEIGLFTHRHHSSIIHSCAWVDSRPDVQERVRELRS
jgi:chromosomal replication initiation ATPase DnaA